MRRSPIIAMFMLPALLAACGPGNKQGTGTIVGAVAGGAAGSAVVTAALRGEGLVPPDIEVSPDSLSADYERTFLATPTAFSRAPCRRTFLPTTALSWPYSSLRC